MSDIHTPDYIVMQQRKVNYDKDYGEISYSNIFFSLLSEAHCNLTMSLVSGS